MSATEADPESSAWDAKEALCGWRPTSVADGVALVSPDGLDAGVLRYHLRQPLRRFRDIVEDALAGARRAGMIVELGRLERMTTTDGEHAGLVTAVLRAAGAHVERTLSFVAGDDYGTLLDVAAALPERFADLRLLARRLTEDSRLWLGARRARRYEFQSPPGWILLARPDALLLLHPDYPRGDARIEIGRARPVRGRDSALGPVSDLPDPPPRHASRRVVEVRVAGVLRGVVTEWDRAEGALHAAAELSDGRYLYPLAVSAAPATRVSARRAFPEVLFSVVPIPAVREPERAGQAMAAWVE